MTWTFENEIRLLQLIRNGSTLQECADYFRVSYKSVLSKKTNLYEPSPIRGFIYIKIRCAISGVYEIIERRAFYDKNEFKIIYASFLKKYVIDNNITYISVRFNSNHKSDMEKDFRVTTIIGG